MSDAVVTGAAVSAAQSDDFSGPRGTPPHEVPATNQNAATSASWLLLFRTIVITVLLGATIVFRTMRGDPATDVQSLAIYTVCALTYATILIAALWIRAHGGANANVTVYGQLTGDCIVASVLVLTTGGHESAFTFLYIISIFNAAAALGQRAALVIAATAATFYAVTLGIQASALADSIGILRIARQDTFAPLLVNTLAFFLVAYLASSLTSTLMRTRQRLSHAEAALVRAEASHEDVLQSIPSGVLTLGADGSVRFMNAAGAEIFGYSSAQEVLSDEGRVLPLVEVDKPVGSRFEATVETPAGRRVVGAKIAPLKRADRTEGRVIVFQDLTEVQLLRRQLSKADRLRSVGRFAAGVAHEIRNPLASMMGCLQLLEEDMSNDAPLGEDGQRLVGIVLRETERLSQLITDFLTYARPAPPHADTVDLNRLAENIIETHNTDENKALSLEFLSPGHPVDAHVDAHQVQQVLWNLVKNAERAAFGKSAAKGIVRVEVRDVGETALLFVDDNGPGIPADERAHVFEPFFTTSSDGTGLGLSTAYQLVDALGGRIDIEDSALGGARFVVALPARAGQSLVPQRASSDMF